ncbi:MAG: hypothetical protein HY286_18855 [Planctomycetes bacterium]|nr:hypothetical protein [Planctomycetota bacterium]
MKTSSLLKFTIFLGVAFGAARNVNAQIAGGGNPEQEIKELFKKVEKDLQEIDKLLLDAGKDAPAIQVSASNCKEVARDALGRQKLVSDNIQKIMDLIPECPGGT